MARRDPNPLWAYLYFPVDIVVYSKEIPPNLLLQTATPSKKHITDIAIGRVTHVYDGTESKPEVIETGDKGKKALWDKIKELICRSKKQT